MLGNHFKAGQLSKDLRLSIGHPHLTMIGQALQSVVLPRYPLHRENRNNDPKKSLQGKTQEIWKFCQNTHKEFGLLKM